MIAHSGKSNPFTLVRFALWGLVLLFAACTGQDVADPIGDVATVEQAVTEAAPEIEEAATAVSEAAEAVATAAATEVAPTPEPIDEPTVAPTAEPETAAEPTSLRFAIHVAEQNLTPWNQGSGYPGYYMMTLFYDTLFWKDPQNVPQPWLVEEWDVSEDGLVWTLKLHENVTWHDGEPLTAEDVRFTIEYLREFPRPRYTPPLAPIASIDIPDTYTVVLTLSEPSASFLLQPLADLPILPQHIWEDVTDPESLTTEPPIGSGPYRMVEYTPEQVWRFEANDDYFKGRPVVDEIVMPFIQDPSATFLALQTDQIDATSQNLPPELVAEFEGAEGMEVLTGPDMRGWYLYMNAERPPFDQPDFRRAILYALDVDEMVETLLLGFGTPGAPGFVHPALPWANPDTEDQVQDPARAAELLDGLGFVDSDGDGVREGADGQPLTFELLVRANDPVAVRTAELTSEWVAEVGIQLNVTALESQTVGQRIWPDTPVGQFQGDYFIALHSWAAAAQLDPEFLARLFHSDPAVGTINRAAYNNPAYDQLAEEQSRMVDPDERRQLLFEMQALLAEDVPANGVYFPDGLSPYRPGAFDDWVFYSGVGILNKATFLP